MGKSLSENLQKLRFWLQIFYKFRRGYKCDPRQLNRKRNRNNFLVFPNCSDELVVNTWVESPYWQFFTCETYLQTKLPIDPSSLMRWRKRMGEEGVVTLLLVTIDAAHRGGMLKTSSFDKIIVDTTVMPKAMRTPQIAVCLRKAASTWSN